MILLSKSRWLCLALLPVLFVVASASVQGQSVVYEGKIGRLQVTQVQGDSYLWKIYTNHTLTTEATVSEVAFINGNLGSSITVQWKKGGDYYFTVTAFGSTGCTNLKVGKVKVIPILFEALAGDNQVIGACHTAVLDASRSIGNIVSSRWSMIDPGASLSNPDEKITQFNISPTYKGPFPADFRVKLMVRDRQGNTDLDTITVTINQAPVADVYISGKLEKDGSMLIDGTVSQGTDLKYKWSTNEGKIIGDNEKSIIAVNGAGIYTLEITDSYGCQSMKSFRFPLESTVLIANRDYGRIPWTEQIKISVLDNDYDSENDINPASVKILENPRRGSAVINKDGTITYGTNINKPGNDYFVYEVCDSLEECVSAEVLIDIYDAGLTIPEAFSPNGDNDNELLIFKGLENYPKSKLHVYTRGGQLVYESEDYLNDWDGKLMKTDPVLPTGTYYYVLELGSTNRIIKGFVFIKY